MQAPNPSPPYYLQRPNSPKALLPNPSTKNISLTLSIGANQSSPPLPQRLRPHDAPSLPAQQQELTLERLEQELRQSSKENSVLREENTQLRRELLRLRREPTFENSRSLEKFSLSPDFSDLRGTIKKEMGEMRELRAKVESLGSQCRMYEEIIAKMEERMKKLAGEGERLRAELEECQCELGKVEQLRERTGGVARLVGELEGKLNMEQLEWMRWKQGWLAEKECYLQRIRDLEKLAARHHHAP